MALSWVSSAAVRRTLVRDNARFSAAGMAELKKHLTGQLEEIEAAGTFKVCLLSL